MINPYEYNLGDVVFVNQLDDYATVNAIIHEGIFSEDINIDSWSTVESGYIVEYDEKFLYIDEI